MNYLWQIKSFDELNTRELYEILRLRQEVFAVEQNSVYLDLDGLDQGSTHMLCRYQGRLVAYLRSLPPGLSYSESSLGRIVVTPELRGLKLGQVLVHRGIAYNLEHWPDSGLRINAQAYLRDFYQNLGFDVEGQEYELDGIMHLYMVYRTTPAERE